MLAQALGNEKMVAVYDLRKLQRTAPVLDEAMTTEGEKRKKHCSISGDYSDRSRSCREEIE